MLLIPINCVRADIHVETQPNTYKQQSQREFIIPIKLNYLTVLPLAGRYQPHGQETVTSSQKTWSSLLLREIAIAS